MNFDQSAQIKEEIDVSGKRLASYGPNIIGEVEVIYRSKKDGKAIFTKSLHKNDLLVTGAVFFSEKGNNMRSGYRTTALDEKYDVHRREVDYTDADWRANISKEQICGVMIGNGGCGQTYNHVYKVNRSDLSVPGMIPFRVGEVIVDDLPLDTNPYNTDGNGTSAVMSAGNITKPITGATRKKYFLCAVDGKYIYYYGKTWDIEPEICVLYEDGTTVPLNANELVTDKFVRVFTRYSITIDQSDVREWFKKNDGSTMQSLVNSIGLVSGWPVDDPWGFPEFCNVRGITTFNMENHELKDSESTIEIIYRLFVQ
jgi:hypothetical protein